MGRKLLFVLYCVVILEIAARIFLWFSLNRYANEHIEEPYRTRIRQFCEIVSTPSTHLAEFGYQFDPICYALPKDEKFFRGPDRGYEVAKDKPADQIRIMCIGVSTTFGIAVDYEYSWPRILEKKLRAQYPHKDIKVLNAGIPGASPKQVKRIFQLYLTQYSPDIVLSRNGFNYCDPYEIPPRSIFIKYWLWRTLYESRLFRIVCVLIDEHIKKTTGRRQMYDAKDTVYEFLCKRSGVPPEDSALSHPANGHKVIERIANEHGIQYAVAIDDLTLMPDGQLVSDYDHDDVEKIVLLLPAFEKRLEDVSARDLFADDCHLTELGTDLVAEEVFDFLTTDEDIKKLFE